ADDPLRQVLGFVWGADPLPPADDTLRPDVGPAYLPIWADDPYSKDLADSFLAVLRDRLGPDPDRPPWPQGVFHGVGDFERANREEEFVAASLTREVDRTQQRPLLILPTTSQPCRRFLRALRRQAPVLGRRFVVVTGDSIEFNKVYRDRNLT